MRFSCHVFRRNLKLISVVNLKYEKDETVMLYAKKKISTLMRVLLRSATCKLLMVIHILKSDDVLFQLLRNRLPTIAKSYKRSLHRLCIYRFLFASICYKKFFNSLFLYLKISLTTLGDQVVIRPVLRNAAYVLSYWMFLYGWHRKKRSITREVRITH